MSKRPVVILKPKEGRRARAGAPWIFSNEIAPGAKELPPGSVVDVKFDDGQPLGSGFFNPKSLITVRLFARSLDANPNRKFFERHLARALALRDQVYARPFYRLVHAEGDGLPGLVIDRFGDTVVVQITIAGMELVLAELTRRWTRCSNPRPSSCATTRRRARWKGLTVLVRAELGNAGRIVVEENGARYFADLGSGQKTGWYYDQRDNRAFIARTCRGQARCWTPIAIPAASASWRRKAGASEVVCLDSSEPALALAEESAAPTGCPCAPSKPMCSRNWTRLAAEKEKFDIVVADPPPFVKSKKDLEPGAKAYRKLARLAAGVTAPGGLLLLASCSHNIPLERFASECAAGILRSGRTASLIRTAGAGPDHPVHPMLPESAYLKALVYALD